MNAYSIVIPTIGRPSLRTLLDSLERAMPLSFERIVIVDDRPHAAPLDLGKRSPEFLERMRVVRSGGRGPAAARNTGWRMTQTSWVCFLDDDVVVEPQWACDLARDLDVPPHVAGVQGKIFVPLPPERPATDWERNVAALASSVWITADMAYRRTLLDALGGFDERFKRAYREDCELAIRAGRAGFELRMGDRGTCHPVRAADPWVSVRLQRGNADDVLMRALHGAQWRILGGSPRGRFPLHAATVAMAALTVTAGLRGRRMPATIACGMWFALSADFAWRRIAPGPRDVREIATMAATSAVIPFAAVFHKCRGVVQLRRLLRGEAA